MFSKDHSDMTPTLTPSPTGLRSLKNPDLITKTCLFKYIEISLPNLQIKTLIFFIFLLKI